MFVLTEATPNPDAMKFIPHVRLTGGAAWAFRRADFDPTCSALAARLFEIDQVAAVFIAEDFVTVTRSGAEPTWSAMRLAVIAVIADHLESGEPAVASAEQGLTDGADQDDIEQQIRETLARWVRPGAAKDGGDVLFERFDAQSGVLVIRMRGACGGCPSSRLTLKAGIERIVRRYVPEVLSVEEAVQPAPTTEPSATRSWIARLGGAARKGPAIRPLFTHRGRVLPDRTADDSRPSSAALPSAS